MVKVELGRSNISLIIGMVVDCHVLDVWCSVTKSKVQNLDRPWTEKSKSGKIKFPTKSIKQSVWLNRPMALYVSGKLLTYPSPKPKFYPKWEVSVNVGLGRGRWAVSQKSIMIPVRWAEFQNREFFSRGIQNSRLWNPQFCSMNPVWNPANYWNPESNFHWREIQNPLPRIRNPQPGIQNPRLSWISLYSTK